MPQERIANDAAHDVVSYTYDKISPKQGRKYLRLAAAVHVHTAEDSYKTAPDFGGQHIHGNGTYGIVLLTASLVYMFLVIPTSIISLQ